MMPIEYFTFTEPDVSSLLASVLKWFREIPRDFGIMGGQSVADFDPTRSVKEQARLLHERFPDYLHLEFEDTALAFILKRGLLKCRYASLNWSPNDLLRRLTGLAFDFGVFNTAMIALWRRDFGYEPEIPLSGHDPQDLYCAIKGQAGHDHLTSRRLLEYGPWRLLRDEQHDLSLVQFYDHEETDPETAAEQAVDGHDLLSDLDGGCFGTDGRYGYRNQIRGFYVAAQRQLRIVVHGREIPYSEMLDACALRYYRRDDPHEPLDSVAFVFMDPAEAQKYLHDLWLRELQCWTIIDGQEVRLDADYHPPPVKPDWVAKVEAREAAAG